MEVARRVQSWESDKPLAIRSPRHMEEPCPTRVDRLRLWRYCRPLGALPTAPAPCPRRGWLVQPRGLARAFPD